MHSHEINYNIVKFLLHVIFNIDLGNKQALLCNSPTFPTIWIWSPWMTAPSREVPPSLQPNPQLDTTISSHVVVSAAGTPRSVGHMEETTKFDTPSSTPVLTDSGLGDGGKNIPHPGPEATIGHGNVENGKKDSKSS